jgi:uracil-DNA glycosylase
MPFSERQLAMLQEMKLRVWQPLPQGAVASPQLQPQPQPQEQAQPQPQRRGETRPASAITRAPNSPSESPQAAPPHTPPVPIAELPAEIATLGWPELRAAVAACRACRLCESRTQTVFGVGHERAHWMIVGEAPGQQEDAQGEPFVGAAGQLLDAMLRALGLSRAADGEPAQRVFIANTLKCRPPGNRNPQPDEMQRCEPFLVRQIQLVQPRLILAMGRFAVQALLRTSEPIGRLRGRAHRYQGVPLVVTYHPAYLLRNLPDKARAWEDLCLAADLMERA